MDELHQRLIDIGLRAAAEHGFALAGGYAVQAHQVVERLSDDVDLFTSWDRRDEVPAAAERVAAAYRDAGFQVAIDEQSEHLVRLLITDPATNPHGDPAEATKVELLADLRFKAPVQMSIGPVLHRDDVAAGKVSALFSRAAARDYIDVAALLTGGHYTREQLLALAAERDNGSIATSSHRCSLGSTATRTWTSCGTASRPTGYGPYGPKSTHGPAS